MPKSPEHELAKKHKIIEEQAKTLIDDSIKASVINKHGPSNLDPLECREKLV